MTSWFLVNTLGTKSPPPREHSSYHYYNSIYPSSSVTAFDSILWEEWPYIVDYFKKMPSADGIFALNVYVESQVQQDRCEHALVDNHYFIRRNPMQTWYFAERPTDDKVPENHVLISAMVFACDGRHDYVPRGSGIYGIFVGSTISAAPSIMVNLFAAFCDNSRIINGQWYNLKKGSTEELDYWYRYVEANYTCLTDFFKSQTSVTPRVVEGDHVSDTPATPQQNDWMLYFGKPSQSFTPP